MNDYACAFHLSLCFFLTETSNSDRTDTSTDNNDDIIRIVSAFDKSTQTEDDKLKEK